MSRQELEDKLMNATLDELSYIFGRYCGPHNTLLREKEFGSSAKYLNKLVKEIMFYKSLDEVLLSDEPINLL